MKLIRELERRLEYLLDGVAGRVFRGPLHPAELAANLVRRLDLEIDRDMVAPNHIDILVAASDLAGEVPPEIPREIGNLLEEAAAERGWRLEGPVQVTIRPDPGIGTGRVRMMTDTRSGERRPWGLLHGEPEIELRVNRSVVGREPTCDVTIADDRVSRRHALIWQEAGRVFVSDLDSSNGTTVDGRPVGSSPVTLSPGSVVTFGAVSFRYHPI